MKKILNEALVALALAAPLTARAWAYQDGDVLLIFRQSGLDDVEFDLGNVSQFLNVPYGQTLPVTGWDLSLVTSTFGSDLTGVSVVLLATTSRVDPNLAAWVTSGDPTAVALDVTGSSWQGNFWSIINSVGTRPSTYQVPAAGASSYAIDPSGTYALASYDQIVSGNGQNAGAIPQLGGHAAFRVEQAIPGSLTLWQIQPSTSLPKPPATLLGTFAITAAGQLTFTAGAPPPSVLSIVRDSGNVNTVSFSTAVGGNYWLAYTNTLGAPVSTWPLVSGPVVGDGNNNSLTHATTDANGFYRVVRAP